MPISNVSKYVTRNNSNPFDEKDTRNSPAPRGSPQTRRTMKTEVLSHAERQRKAESLRVPIPPTYLNSAYLKQEPGTDMKGLATTVASRPHSVGSRRGTQPRNTFDDTDFDDTISSGLSTLDGQNRDLVAFTTDYNRPSIELLSAVNAKHYAQQHGGYSGEDNESLAGDVIPKNWQEQVATEKRMQMGGFSSTPSVADEYDYQREDYQSDQRIVKYNQDEYLDQNIKYHTPEARDVYDKEEIHKQTPPRPQSMSMAPPRAPQAKVAINTFASASVPTSKSSSYVEPSEDEAPPIQPAPKKVRSEADYDSQALKAMSYGELDKQPFETDPRAGNARPPVDEHGVQLTLHRKLGNLSKMKEEDVRTMFSTQKDQEWEDTGAWFMDQFGQQMKQLMDLRQERRMIALQFEMEVKRRNAVVAAKTEDVEANLRYLRNGGNDLMGKRMSPPK